MRRLTFKRLARRGFGRSASYEANYGGRVLARIDELRLGGWFWYGFGQNTCQEPADTLDVAKDQIRAFLEENRERIDAAWDKTP